MYVRGSPGEEEVFKAGHVMGGGHGEGPVQQTLPQVLSQPGVTDDIVGVVSARVIHRHTTHKPTHKHITVA